MSDYPYDPDLALTALGNNDGRLSEKQAIEAAERAYRRGCQQTAAYLRRRLESIEMLRAAMVIQSAEDVLQCFRFDGRKHPLLLDEMERKLGWTSSDSKETT